ncbi:MAG TPA: hypothetical protein VGQ63_09435 [Pseudolabrys sp.]|jgi:hypothetical protein|nr:hypothetical protein [Pseudolabrys sp.]
MNIDLTTILVIAGAIIAGESPWRSSKHGLDNYAGETQAWSFVTEDNQQHARNPETPPAVRALVEKYLDELRASPRSRRRSAR